VIIYQPAFLLGLLAIPLHLHSKGVFLSIVIAEGAIAAAGIVLFKRGRWKRQQI